MRILMVGTLTFAASLTLSLPTAKAQGVGLGGYGAMAGMPGASQGGGGTVAPFGGRFGTGLSDGMGSGGGTSFRPRPASAMSQSRTAFTIGPMGGGMSGRLGQGSGRRPFLLRDLGPSRGLGLGGGMRRSMPNDSGMGVMPPNFGSPFRQPPSLLVPASPGAGMSSM